MTKQNENENPMSMEDALNDRMTEPTPSEVTDQALCEAMAEEVLSDQYPESPETTPIPTTTNSPKETETPIVPVSDTTLPQQTIIFTQESVEAEPILTIPPPPQNNEEDPSLRRLKKYIFGEEYSVNWVLLHLTNISIIPKVIPVMTLWDIPRGVDIPSVIFNIVQTPGYIENVYPSLKVVMGSSISNTEWSAGVLTTLAIFDAIKVLPYLEGK